ncbi:MAG: glycosyltransferase family 2 protein [Oscillospiraceae bacterium]|nr:glycosyltransferase family 2 protein [Oscillospiraceae bacterium]
MGNVPFEINAALDSGGWSDREAYDEPNAASTDASATQTGGISPSMLTSILNLMSSLANMQHTVNGISDIETQIVDGTLESGDVNDFPSINRSVGDVMGRVANISRPLACSLCCVTSTLVPECLRPQGDPFGGCIQAAPKCGSGSGKTNVQPIGGIIGTGESAASNNAQLASAPPLIFNDSLDAASQARITSSADMLASALYDVAAMGGDAPSPLDEPLAAPKHVAEHVTDYESGNESVLRPETDDDMVLISIVITALDEQDSDGSLMRLALNSCYDQTMCAIEVVMVGDALSGSVDSAVMDEYARAYPLMFRIVNAPSGISRGEARNHGIDAAQGEYVTFLNRGDQLDPDFCKKMYRAAAIRGADLVVCGYMENGESHKRRFSNDVLFDSVKLGDGLQPRATVRYDAEGTLLSKRFIQDNDLYLLNADNEAYSLALWPAYGSRMAHVSSSLYLYGLSEGSVSTESCRDLLPRWMETAREFYSRLSPVDHYVQRDRMLTSMVGSLIGAAEQCGDDTEDAAAIHEAALMIADLYRRIQGNAAAGWLRAQPNVREALKHVRE